MVAFELTKPSLSQDHFSMPTPHDHWRHAFRTSYDQRGDVYIPMESWRKHSVDKLISDRRPGFPFVVHSIIQGEDNLDAMIREGLVSQSRNSFLSTRLSRWFSSTGISLICVTPFVYTREFEDGLDLDTANRPDRIQHIADPACGITFAQAEELCPTGLRYVQENFTLDIKNPRTFALRIVPKDHIIAVIRHVGVSSKEALLDSQESFACGRYTEEEVGYFFGQVLSRANIRMLADGFTERDLFVHLAAATTETQILLTIDALLNGPVYRPKHLHTWKEHYDEYIRQLESFQPSYSFTTDILRRGRQAFDRMEKPPKAWNKILGTVL